MTVLSFRDMSRYPHDQHVCSFMITVEQWQNVDLQVSDHSDSEISKLRELGMSDGDIDRDRNKDSDREINRETT